MKRVHVACEGPTEMSFVRDVLQSEFPALHLIAFLPGKLTARAGVGRGGDVRYARVWKDFVRSLRHDEECYCTTFFDYYALGRDFPTDDEPHGTEPERKARRIEQAVDRDIAEKMGGNFDSRRFRCYLSMHEFEGLLFSDPSRLAECLGVPEIAPKLTEIRREVGSPEHIDDHRETAPSKRLAAACPGYDKVIGGNVAALSVGIEAMRRECAHFRSWLGWFERLSAEER